MPETSSGLDTIRDSAIAGTGCSRAEALRLAEETLPLDTLLDCADAVRQAHFGTRVNFCGIVNARSGACRENCRFCAQSAHNTTDVEIYRLQDSAKLLNAARAMRHSGASTFGIVTSGPTVSDSELDIICETVRRMRGETGLKPCASLGALSRPQLARLRESGLTRYHHNLETSSAFFPSICTTHTWDERVATVRNALEENLEVCCGGLFGLGESWIDRIDMALTLRELGVRSVPVNFLNPVKGTPLDNLPRLTAEEGLRILAIYRLLLPTATIRVCGGRPSTLGHRQAEMFRAGANALMTGDYLTTAGISPETDRALVKQFGLCLDCDTADTPA